MLIFAIDDEPAVLENLHEAIEEALPDAEIRDFRRGEAALDAMMDGLRPDVVFTDIHMPDIEGKDLAAAVRSLSPATFVVFATATSRNPSDTQNESAHGYLLKPVMADDILEILQNRPF